MVKLFPNRAEGVADFRIIHHPAEFWIAGAVDGDLDFEAMAVQAAAFVGFGKMRQQMRGLDLKCLP